MTIAAGTQLGPYEVLAPLGVGGMGEVYRARDTRVGREVAVKILPRDVAADPVRRNRFEQEARLAASLNHPNVVGLFDLGSDHDPPYIVSELVAGESLRAVMSRGSIPLQKALDLGAQIAEGLAAAHAAGVVHRDIKPENVMVTSEGRAKILDFGLARVEEGRGPDATDSPTVTAAWETPGTTSPGTVMGTASYMSPEQASGQAVDYRTDQFSVGLVLYEMLARRRAFDRPTAAQTMAAIIEDEAAALPTAVPAEAQWLIQRCLSKDPRRRYFSTLDLAQELRLLLTHSSELTSRGGVTVAVGGRRRTRRRTLAGLAGLAALTVLPLRALIAETPRVDLGEYRVTDCVSLPQDSHWPSWSPDGRSIAFVGYSEAERGYQVWVQGLDAPAPVQITHAPFWPRFGSMIGAGLSWSPDSRMIYCLGQVGDITGVFFGGQQGIFRVPAAGGGPVLVQQDAKVAALSPDGNTLVMLAPDTTGYRVYHASPPDAPRRLYEPVPFLEGTVDAVPLAFSPDGKKIIVRNSDKKCWLLPWPPGQGRPVHALDRGSGRLSWMPDSRHVVSGTGRMFLTDTRSGRSWPVFLDYGIRIMEAAVSPDGARIAYTSDVSHSDIVEVPLDGSPPRTLVGTRQSESGPSISRDGRELVYTSFGTGRGEIWSMDVKAATHRRVVVPEDCGAFSLLGPDLSPDRKRLAFVGVTDAGLSSRSPSITLRVFIAFTRGGLPVRATGHDEENVGHLNETVPTWSPAGDRLAYVRQGAPMWLEVVRPGGEDRPVRLWEGEAYYPPQWSPTGEWIAIADTGRVFLVSPDGRESRRLNTTEGPVAWSPDGRTLYVIHSDTLVWVGAIDVRTGAERPVIRDLGDLAPSGSWLGQRVTVTPDGRSLVYEVSREGADIKLLEGVKIPEPWYRRLRPW